MRIPITAAPFRGAGTRRSPVVCALAARSARPSAEWARVPAGAPGAGSVLSSPGKERAGAPAAKPRGNPCR